MPADPDPPPGHMSDRTGKFGGEKKVGGAYWPGMAPGPPEG
jgi:hypothetical protein